MVKVVKVKIRFINFLPPELFWDFYWFDFRDSLCLNPTKIVGFKNKKEAISYANSVCGEFKKRKNISETEAQTYMQLSDIGWIFSMSSNYYATAKGALKDSVGSLKYVVIYKTN